MEYFEIQIKNQLRKKQTSLFERDQQEKEYESNKKRKKNLF